jgi:hypothetical protein
MNALRATDSLLRTVAKAFCRCVRVCACVMYVYTNIAYVHTFGMNAVSAADSLVRTQKLSQTLRLFFLRADYVCMCVYIACIYV